MQASRVAVLARAIGVAIVTLWPALAAAQGTTASIAGFVTDDSKASLPGATVTVKHVDTGQARVLTTDGQGRYRADALAPGQYAVTVELSGFRTAQYDDVSLSVGQASTLNVQLQIGGISERVVVSGDATLVATRQSSVAALVDQSQIRELPLNGRDFSQLTLLQLGVTSSPTTSQTVDRGMGTQVSIAGSRPNQISYQLDGADVNTQGNGSPGSAAGGMLGVDTVREFQVLVNNYSAEYGRSSGGIVVAITRSGTNSLTGSAFEFNRDSRFDSRTYFDDPSKPIPPLRRNQFGGTLGGPLVRDQTFFFGSYEGLRQTRGATTIANVPSDATRARTDLSALTRPYLLLYPIANGPQNGASAQFIQQVVSPTRENLAVGKVDHNLTKMQSLSVKYSFDKASVDDTQAIPYWTTDTRTRSQSVVGEHKWILSPRVLNDVKVAWNQAFEDTQNVENRSFDPALQFIPNSRFGTTSITGLTQLGPDAQTPTFVNLKSLQAIDNLTWSRGSHSIKTGVSYTHYMNDQDSSFDLGGVYAFTSIDNFVLGKVNTFEGQVPGSTTARRWRQDLVGLFAQDDWSARRNLTLNAGVRYEFITEPKELDGRSSALPDLQSSTFVTGGAIFKNPSLKNVAPRGGFAWNNPEQHLPGVRRPHATVLQLDQSEQPDVPECADHGVVAAPARPGGLQPEEPVPRAVQPDLPARTVGPHGRDPGLHRRPRLPPDPQRRVQPGRPRRPGGRLAVLPAGRHAPQPGVQQHAVAPVGRRVLVRRRRGRRAPPIQRRTVDPGVVYLRQLERRGIAGGGQRRLRQQLPAALLANPVPEQGTVGFRHPP